VIDGHLLARKKGKTRHAIWLVHRSVIALGAHKYRQKQRPLQIGSRFSANAIAPRGVLRDHHAASDLALLLHASESVQSGELWTIRFEALRASGPVSRYLAGQLECGVHGAPGSARAVDDAQLVAALGVDRIARQRQLHGQVVRNPPRKPQQRRAGRDEAALDLGDAEPRAPGRDDQIARQRDLEAAGDGEALDRGDQRLLRGRAG